MADQVLSRDGPVSVPMDYQVPQAGELIPLTVSAAINGTSATSAFYATVQVISPSGRVMFSAISSAIAAGASAVVSWFPRVGVTTSTPSAQTGWTRRTEPLISPTVAWEQNAVYEPEVRYESGTWKMWHGGGWGNPGIGFATCTADPSIPSNWTKFAGNPVIGQGGSGIAGAAVRPNVVLVAGVYHCFYADNVAGGNLKRTTSANGTTWAAPTTAIAKASIAGAPGGLNNSEVYFDGSTYFMFVEGSTPAAGGGPYGLWLFTNNSITNDGGWTLQNSGAGLTGLIFPTYDDGYGQAPNIAQISGSDSFTINGRSTLWYHVSDPIGGPVFSDITHGYSTDPTYVTWTCSDVLDLAHNGTAYEKDQSADCCVHEVNGVSYMFYDGTDNTTPAAYINLASFPGTLAELLTGTG